MLIQLFCAFSHPFDYCILMCPFSWWSKEHVAVSNVLFCSIFINIWEKSRSLKFLSFSYFSSLFSILSKFLIHLFVPLSLFCQHCLLSVLCLPAIGFILFLTLSKSHSLSWTHSSEAFSCISTVLPPSLSKSCLSQCSVSRL